MASWPVTLPAPLIQGYQLAPSDPVLRSNMDGGNTKARRTTSVRFDKVTGTIRITDAQMAIFRTWFDNAAEANAGQGWFTISLMVGTTGLVTVEARFASIWQASIVGYKNWDVSLPLEVRYA
jgi:hypothetical protein